jgi:hypothetical protein
MIEPDNLRYTELALRNEAGAIPALGFAMLMTDPEQQNQKGPVYVECI